MNKMLCVLPYCSKDIESAKNLLQWITTLGGCPRHSCLLIADVTVPKEQRMEVKALALPSFASVDGIPVAIPTTGYAPNHMFMLAAQQIMFSYKWPWLWLEPDAVPLIHGWLDALADEYAVSPKRFLGNLVKGDQPGLPELHLTGVSIYPPDAFPIYDAFASIKSANVAWDMEAATAVVPRAKHTCLIQSFWGTRELPPTFVKETAAGQPPNALPFSFLKPEAVLFHRCKDGTLIDLLRQQEKILSTIVPPFDTPPPKRGPGRPPKNSPALVSEIIT